MLISGRNLQSRDTYLQIIVALGIKGTMNQTEVLMKVFKSEKSKGKILETYDEL